jgi:twitching motility protein PilT
MQTFDQSLYDLYQKGRITLDEALRQATNPDDLALKIKGIHSTAEITQEPFKEDEKEEDIPIERFHK